MITPGVVQFLKQYEATPTSARQIRTRLKDIFDKAILEGKVEQNPVTVTHIPKVTVMRSRLSLEKFNTVFESAQGWAANSMLLALITGQRLGDIANMKVADVSDGWLHVIQNKSGSLVRLALDLRLDEINMSVGEVVSSCRDRVVSRHLIHHTKNSAKAKAGGAVPDLSISKEFKDARSLSGL